MPYTNINAQNAVKFSRRFRRLPMILNSMPILPGKGGKLISQSTFQLKAAGWYLTDYAKKNSSSSGERSKTNSTAEKPSETKTSTDSASTATSSESKP